MSLGLHFEREIREQPGVWERVAASGAASRLAHALEGEMVLVGSGSSLFAAQLGAIALRRRGISAHAVAATEALGDARAYQRRTVVAISQSGHSSDLLAALDALKPRRTIALTNTPDSPLANRAQITIDVQAGPERAVPATKSVTATIAILLGAASILAGKHNRDAPALIAAAQKIRTWLEHDDHRDLAVAAAEIAVRQHVMILGTDYGAPIAREAALKFKESTYIHAEGFEAGEFRHGSAAMLDRDTVVIGIVDRDGVDIVGRPLREAAKTGAIRYAIGTVTVDDIARLGPIVDDAYNVLAWLVTVQLLALHVARARGIDSDTPRGLTKAVINP
ncbi:MAG TPA: SIS domain-containing protein [Candidatus Lustribacter sp.]